MIKEASIFTKLNMNLLLKKIQSLVSKYPTLVAFEQYSSLKFIVGFLLIIGFSSCKRSTQQQTHRDYDERLIQSLQTLEQKYADKKVRINTWDKKADAYLDIQVLNKDQQPTETLTIGDSVKFIGIDLESPAGIQAKIKLKNNDIGYIPYSKVEEFEPATHIDPDLKD